MTKIKLGIDIDGTVSRPDAIVTMLQKYFDQHIKYEDMTDYDITTSFGIKIEDFLPYEEEFYSTSKVAPFAGEVLNRLAQHFELVYITAREERLRQLSTKWFEDNHLPYSKIILVGGHDKVATVKAEDVKIFIDDRYENCIDIATYCEIPVLMIDAPYNQKPLVEGITRVNNWLQIEKYIQDNMK